MSAERRQYLRVLFEATIDVRTGDWRDPAATGLDISLNGCRFHCEHSMSDGESVIIRFDDNLELEGKVRWCWPIEWYYQAAVQFTEITEEEQSRLRDYIVGVTGEEYEDKPDEQETIGTSQITEPASSNDVSEEEFEELEEVTASIDDEELEDLSPLDEDELSLITDAPDEQTASLSKGEALPLPEFKEGDLTPMQFQSKQLIILGGRKEQADLLKQYLEERLGIVVEYVTKKQNLWRLMKLDTIDMILMEWDLADENDPLETLEQTKDQFPETQIIALSGPLALEHRLQAINSGADSFITRPVHLSAIAQSILLSLSKNDGSEETLSATGAAMPALGVANELEPIGEDDPNTPVDLLDDDLNLSEELDLIDEEF
ncbi:MAG: PilZ domain-containing protein [SAR324 cluster bacterium]|nr:PilZ domain-containing protein [SAR324 cluster bacterium]